jgi:hypothetical protein
LADTREIKIERIKKGMQLLFERSYFEPSDIGVSVNVFEWYCYQAGGILVKRRKRLLCVSREYLESVYKV